MNYFSSKLRALSSSGRAPALQAGGREFESHSVQYKNEVFILANLKFILSLSNLKA